MNKEIFKDINKLNSIATQKGYIIFKDADKPYNLNIWGIRSKNRNSGTFDDLLIVFWGNKGYWDYEMFDVTVDPSDIALFEKKNKLGTAIIYPSQYKGVWQLGLHKGSYEALVQTGDITVIRDFNKDVILDIPDSEIIDNWLHFEKRHINVGKVGTRYVEEYKDNGIVKYILETGNDFGINCHRASSWKILEKVGLYSEGCVVHQDPNKYNKVFIDLIKKSINNWGNSFTFTLVNEEDFY